MIGDGGEGDLQINTFMCERFSATDHQFGLMWSMKVFEHIPQKLHAGMRGRDAQVGLHLHRTPRTKRPWPHLFDEQG